MAPTILVDGTDADLSLDAVIDEELTAQLKEHCLLRGGSKVDISTMQVHAWMPNHCSHRSCGRAMDKDGHGSVLSPLRKHNWINSTPAMDMTVHTTLADKQYYLFVPTYCDVRSIAK